MVFLLILSRLHAYEIPDASAKEWAKGKVNLFEFSPATPFTNPSAAFLLRTRSVYFSFSQFYGLPELINLWVTGAYPVSDGTFMASVYYQGSALIREMHAALGYAHRLGRYSGLGVTGGAFYFSANQYGSFWTPVLSLGFTGKVDNVWTGISVYNLGQIGSLKEKYYRRLESVIRGGIGIDTDCGVTVQGMMEFYSTGYWSVGIGAIYSGIKNLALLIGGGGPPFFAGTGIEFKRNNLVLVAAGVYHAYLGGSWHVAIGWNFRSVNTNVGA